jgi:hypothetical protein
LPPEIFWFLIAALAGLAIWSMVEQRCNDRETEQALFELGRRVTLLEAEKFVLPPPPAERLLIPPPFPLPPLPELPWHAKLTRVWRRG